MRSNKVIRILERELYPWENVHRKEGFWGVEFYVGERIFAFVKNGYLVLTHSTKEERDEMITEWEAARYRLGDSEVGFFYQIPVTPENVMTLLPLIRRSYEHTSKWKGI